MKKMKNKYIENDLFEVRCENTGLRNKNRELTQKLAMAELKVLILGVLLGFVSISLIITS